ncbi:MAG: tRNA lysidine(34) synthetase TilS [Anaerolineales bacterium]|nr:tRNA lysidine(34) synthetase TilS [Anaerolineales bacterium]
MKKKSDVPEIVERFIRRHGLFDPREKILAAVSGGADSLCLLLVLHQLGYALHIGHFDHGLRPESGRDADAVRRAAERLGLPFSLGQGDVREHAGRNRMTMEEAARDLRYAFLLQTAKQAGLTAVATGHTMDDQAETVLMHLIRGSGLKGLGGIRPAGRIPVRGDKPVDAAICVVRPLLCLTHAQTAGYCAQADWTPLEDSTNQDTGFTRNKIRRELIPRLEEYNASIVDALSRFAEVARAQDDFLEQAAAKLWDQSAGELAPGLLRYPLESFRNEPLAVRQALLRRAVMRLTGTLEDLAFDQVDRVLDFVQDVSGPSRMDLALGVDVEVEKEWLVLRFQADLPAAPEWEALELPCPGSLSIHHPEWKFVLSETDRSELSDPEPDTDRWTVRIDADRIRLPLTIRKRKTGDKFHPLGMAAPQSLNDFLSSHHLTFSERDHWPLVCDADGIIWIPGYRLKNGIAGEKGSRRCLKVHVDRKG